MKAVILAGGLGTRISEKTSVKPKPMVEIGGKPILWHIMKIYSAHGIDNFIICLYIRVANTTITFFVADLCVAALCRSHMTIKFGLNGFAIRSSSPR